MDEKWNACNGMGYSARARITRKRVGFRIVEKLGLLLELIGGNRGNVAVSFLKTNYEKTFPDASICN